MTRHSIRHIILFLILLLASCGVKRDVVSQPEQDGMVAIEPVAETVVNPTYLLGTNMVDSKLGLLWKNDTLLLSVNQGRRLSHFSYNKDTLCVYETEYDRRDSAKRQYALCIPESEMLIIRYCDSLVYPLMPAIEECMYPLDINSMGEHVLHAYYEKKRKGVENKQKEGTRFGGINSSLFPLELRAGTYIYNAGMYHKFGINCECEKDSTIVLVLNVDGTWQLYENQKLSNCGILRKSAMIAYEAYDYKSKVVLFRDTMAISGHIVGTNEIIRRTQENMPLAPNEYVGVGKASSNNYDYMTIYPCKEDKRMQFLFRYGSNEYFMYEGTTCGWERVNDL